MWSWWMRKETGMRWKNPSPCAGADCPRRNPSAMVRTEAVSMTRPWRRRSFRPAKYREQMEKYSRVRGILESRPFPSDPLNGMVSSPRDADRVGGTDFPPGGSCDGVEPENRCPVFLAVRKGIRGEPHGPGEDFHEGWRSFLCGKQVRCFPR